MLLFVVLQGRPYALQEGSAIIYTIFAVFFTFSAVNRLRPYMFTCPAVRPQIPRLLWRHVGFLVALLALQTTALAARSSMSDWWWTDQRSGGTPFDIALLFLCESVGLAQVFTNRSLLDRAHWEFKG